jgi:hypothetical protein
LRWRQKRTRRWWWFDAQQAAEFVVHLDRGFTEPMLDLGPFDPGRELAAQFLSQLRSDMPAEEVGDLLGFDAQNRLADQLLVERGEGGGGAERKVGGIVRAPVRLQAQRQAVALEHFAQAPERRDPLPQSERPKESRS